MPGTNSTAEKFEIQLLWARERLIELSARNVAPVSSGLVAREATLAMAAARLNMPVVRRMVSLGADPSVKEFLAYRMAAAAGDMDTMMAIEAIASPTEYAVNDALAWARANNRGEAIDHIMSLPLPVASVRGC